MVGNLQPELVPEHVLWVTYDNDGSPRRGRVTHLPFISYARMTSSWRDIAFEIGMEAP